MPTRARSIAVIEVNIEQELAIDELTPGKWSMLTRSARLDILDVLRAHLEVVNEEVRAEVVNLVRGILHVFNDHEGGVEHDPLGDLEEVLATIQSYIGDVEASAVSKCEGCGLLGGPFNEEFDGLRLVFVTPVERLPILGFQNKQEVSLVHRDMGLAKEDVLGAQVDDDVLW